MSNFFLPHNNLISSASIIKYSSLYKLKKTIYNFKNKLKFSSRFCSFKDNLISKQSSCLFAANHHITRPVFVRAPQERYATLCAVDGRRDLLLPKDIYTLGVCSEDGFKNDERLAKLVTDRESTLLLSAADNARYEPEGSSGYAARAHYSRGKFFKYKLETYHRSNQDTCLLQKPAIKEGDWVQTGDLLADSASSIGGELAIGHNIIVAYMPWEGYNYEDAILINERLVYEDIYTSIHIERYEIATKDTKLGPEQITREIPDINENEISHLDKNGIAKIGSWVEEGDILVGKITPFNVKTLTPQQNLLYRIFGKPLSTKKDSSLRAPKGIKANVININILAKQKMQATKTQKSDRKKTKSRNVTGNPNGNVTKPLQSSSKRKSSKKKRGAKLRSMSSRRTEFGTATASTEGCSRREQEQLWASPSMISTAVARDLRNGRSVEDYLRPLSSQHRRLLCSLRDRRLLPAAAEPRRAPSGIIPKGAGADLRSAAPKGTSAIERFERKLVIKPEGCSAPGGSRARYLVPSKIAASGSRAPEGPFGAPEGPYGRRFVTDIVRYSRFSTSLESKIRKVLSHLLVLNTLRTLTTYKICSPLSVLTGNPYKTGKPIYRVKNLIVYSDKYKPYRSRYLYPQSVKRLLGLSTLRSNGQISDLRQVQNSNRLMSSLTSKSKDSSKSLKVRRSKLLLLPKDRIRYCSCKYRRLLPEGAVAGAVAGAIMGKPINVIDKVRYTRKHQILARRKKKKTHAKFKPSYVHIYLAEKRKMQVGDKMAGRHGNKGIVSRILPRQDMPFLPDGTSVDIVLNPLGVPSRMNVGQIYECLLGLAGRYLGEHYKIPPFDEIYGADASRSFVLSKLYEARKKTGLKWLFDPNNPGKMRLFDGRNSECFHQTVTVGIAYVLKLVHMVDDKLHMRSTGPYSLVTQQPLRGRSKQGGQRLGEMEVWAIEGYGAAFVLSEMLTIKSDDMTGRQNLWKNLIENNDISLGTPESFKVLVCELQALCLDIGLFRKNDIVSKQDGQAHLLPSGAIFDQDNVNNILEQQSKSSSPSLVEIDSLLHLA